MPQPGQGSFITKRISRKSVTINDIIVDDFERQRHERAQQYYGKKRPAPKVRALSSRPAAVACARCLLSLAAQARHGDTVVHEHGQGPFSAPPPEINTARMMDALRTAGVGSTLGDGGAAHRERVRRAKQLQPKRPLTAAQLASEAACNAVIAEQRSINFARPADVTERRKRGEAVLSLQFDTLTIGDFVVGSAGGRQRSGRWAPPQRGPQAPPAAQTVGYSRSSEGLWASTDTEATVLAPVQSGASDRWASRVSSRIEQAEMSCICPICSKDGKVCMHVPSELSLAAAADAGHKWVPPPNYKPGARTEAEKAPHLPQICLAQAVLDVLPDGPRVQGRKKDAAVSPSPPAPPLIIRLTTRLAL